MSKKTTITILFFLTLVLSGFLHSWNMLHYPYYESDEGTYVSRAWSMIETGELAPYTYWYDHPPAGWIFIALWDKALGDNFFRFGTSIDTGRALMLFIHIITTGLVFYIVQRVTKNSLVAFFAGFLFSISPLMIYFQRRVLLDNIMIMWIMASVALLLMKRIKLYHYIISGTLFALAVLTKETAVMFGVPILSFVIFSKSKVSKSFRSILWLVSSISVASFYIMYAFLRGEFFPAHIGNEHVSFIQTIIFQISRKGANLPFWNNGSDFMMVVSDWMSKDGTMVWIAIITILLAIFNAIWHKNIRLFLFLFLFYLLFLIRGGIVLNFYVIPLFPIFSIILAILLYNFLGIIFKTELKKTVGVLVLFSLVAVYYGFYAPTKHFFIDETSQQKNAILWIKNNLPEEASIAIDSYALVDIRDPHNINDKTFPNADWYYKINRDPVIRDKKYQSNWQNINYIALTHEMLKQIKTDNYPIVKEAYVNSWPIAEWHSDENTFVDTQNFLTTNGDWAMILRVNDEHYSQLLNAWNSYKKQYIIFEGENYGQVIDLQNNTTTSEGQSYAMLRSVWMNDKDAFSGVWLWTRNHLQYRLDDKLFSWQWKNNKVSDPTNATDADEDIALALLFGYKLWNDDTYLYDAQEIIDDIWNHCVVNINGRYYLLPMRKESADKGSNYLFNPSYISPATYKIFGQVDPSHNWNKLAEDSYRTLNDIGREKNNNIYLPSDWLLLNKKSGDMESAEEYFDHNVDLFSFDAFRILWRVSLDEQWFNDNEAKKYLEKAGEFAVQYYEKNNKLPMSLYPNGKINSHNNSLSVDSGWLVALMYKNPSIAKDFFDKFIDSKYDYKNYNWGQNYYDENWAWFATGAYYHSLTNVWNFNILRE